MSKMKRMVSVALLAGIIVLLNGTPGAAQLKLGYINSGRIMAEYKGFQDVTKRIQDLAGTYEKELQSMRRQLEESFKEFENQQLLLSDERKQEKQREMQESQQKIMAFQEEKFGNQGEISVEIRAGVLSMSLVQNDQGIVVIIDYRRVEQILTVVKKTTDRFNPFDT